VPRVFDVEDLGPVSLAPSQVGFAALELDVDLFPLGFPSLSLNSTSPSMP